MSIEKNIGELHDAFTQGFAAAKCGIEIKAAWNSFLNKKTEQQQKQETSNKIKRRGDEE